MAEPRQQEGGGRAGGRARAAAVVEPADWHGPSALNRVLELAARRSLRLPGAPPALRLCPWPEQEPADALAFPVIHVEEAVVDHRPGAGSPAAQDPAGRADFDACFAGSLLALDDWRLSGADRWKEQMAHYEGYCADKISAVLPEGFVPRDFMRKVQKHLVVVPRDPGAGDEGPMADEVIAFQVAVQYRRAEDVLPALGPPARKAKKARRALAFGSEDEEDESELAGGGPAAGAGALPFFTRGLLGKMHQVTFSLKLSEWQRPVAQWRLLQRMHALLFSLIPVRDLLENVIEIRVPMRLPSALVAPAPKALTGCVSEIQAWLDAPYDGRDRELALDAVVFLNYPSAHRREYNDQYRRMVHRSQRSQSPASDGGPNVGVVATYVINAHLDLGGGAPNFFAKDLRLARILLLEGANVAFQWRFSSKTDSALSNFLTAGGAEPGSQGAPSASVADTVGMQTQEQLAGNRFCEAPTSSGPTGDASAGGPADPSSELPSAGAAAAASPSPRTPKRKRATRYALMREHGGAAALDESQESERDSKCLSRYDIAYMQFMEELPSVLFERRHAQHLQSIDRSKSMVQEGAAILRELAFPNPDGEPVMLPASPSVSGTTKTGSPAAGKENLAPGKAQGRGKARTKPKKKKEPKVFPHARRTLRPRAGEGGAGWKSSWFVV